MGVAPPRVAVPVRVAAGLVALLVVTGAAAAEAGRHASQHHADHPNLLGVRGGALRVSPHEGPSEWLVFIGLSYERTVVHERLEIELSVPVAFSTDREVVSLPADIHFKLPFHPSPRWSPYLAAGPSVDIELEPHRRVLVGGSVAAGAYFWVSDRMGLDVEVDFNVVRGDGHTAHEVLGAAGPVLRF